MRTIQLQKPGGLDRLQVTETERVAPRRGEIVVIPTDTVYGLGADAFDPAAVANVLMAKGRGREMPPPVLTPDVRTVDGLARTVPDWARRLIDELWPGPLTLVLLAQPSLHWDLGETAGTVALRMPDDEIALEVLRETGPMAVTSANRTGEPAGSIRRSSPFSEQIRSTSYTVCVATVPSFPRRCSATACGSAASSP